MKPAEVVVKLLRGITILEQAIKTEALINEREMWEFKVRAHFKIVGLLQAVDRVMQRVSGGLTPRFDVHQALSLIRSQNRRGN